MSFDRITPGSLVLVTGATGYIGSAITDLLLKKGYRVRGVGRSATKAAKFTESLQATFGARNFEFVEVPDFKVAGVFDGVFDGVVGVVHVATETAADALVDAEKALQDASNTVVELMKSAARAGTVKSLVLTSSSVSAFKLEYGKDAKISLDDYTTFFVDAAKNLPESANAGEKYVVIYCATKVHTELEAWKYWRAEKPGYAFNTVLPSTAAGPVLSPIPGYYSTHQWINEIFLGQDSIGLAFMQPSEWLVDVRDVAAIHVGALLSTSTNGERFWASGHPFTANKLLAIWREAFPDRTIRPDFAFPENPKLELIGREKSTELLKGLEGRDWYSLKETVVANVAEAL
ncbi:hypothetical protein BKA62DRAFT_687560 [Auriculariales sp. MPI-PUGE-AT-0066]|nr:hypothetical protein BKA62DRAFT_687560 [Auriculariales sp. MPI-PUGE-AT-0066]